MLNTANKVQCTLKLRCKVSPDFIQKDADNSFIQHDAAKERHYLNARNVERNLRQKKPSGIMQRNAPHKIHIQSKVLMTK